jgi:AraC-like DNA-binding protein
MKPKFEKVPSANSSFLIKEEAFTHFDVPWHVHPEFELTFIHSGQGKRHIGNSIEDLDIEELIFIGPNLPHSWYGSKNNEINQKKKDSQIVIQFSIDFLGKDFFEKPAFVNTLQLLKRAQLGICFYNQTLKFAKKEMRSMLQLNGFDQTLKLLNLLNRLALSNDYKYISCIGFTEVLNKTETDKMNKIYQFILEHFKEQITLNQLAKFASMTPQGFCKYFKIRTKKTFSSFLMEVKISYACRLLIEKNHNVLQISCESGFNNLSNFNRQFKRITKLTPSQYASQFKHL